jgi:hypothetical protein
MGVMCIKDGCLRELCLDHCVYCAVDVERHEPHLATCPMATGVYPSTDGECCGRCNRELDFYRLEGLGVSDDGLLMSLVVCVLDCTTTMADMKR